MLARAGIGTDHVDGNTRLCTATAAEALKQSFGYDGQPSSYTDVDHADVIALYGHNVADTQSVDHRYVEANTVGFAELRDLVADYPPERVAGICGVAADDIRAAGRRRAGQQRAPDPRHARRARRPDRASFGQSRRPAGATRAPISISSSTTPGAWTSAIGKTGRW